MANKRRAFRAGAPAVLRCGGEIGPGRSRPGLRDLQFLASRIDRRLGDPAAVEQLFGTSRLGSSQPRPRLGVGELRLRCAFQRRRTALGPLLRGDALIKIDRIDFGEWLARNNMVPDIDQQRPDPPGGRGADAVRIARFHRTDPEQGWRDRPFFDRRQGDRYRRKRAGAERHIGEGHAQRRQNGDQHPRPTTARQGKFHVRAPMPLR